MTQHPEQRSFRARHLAGPLARVSLHTAGRVVLLYLATTIVALVPEARTRRLIQPSKPRPLVITALAAATFLASAGESAL